MAVTGGAVGIYKFGASGDSITGRKLVNYVRWVGDGTTAAGDTCELANSDGVVIWESIADGTYFLDIMPIHRWVDGVTATFSSGAAFVYTA